MKKVIVLGLLIASSLGLIRAQELAPVKLLNPDLKRGLPIMEAFSNRASVREWSDKKLSLQDLSDLMWAANGINRPGEGKRTAPSATNSQDVDVYVFLQEGAYLYDAKNQQLTTVAKGDFRELAAKTDAPALIVLVSDISRFKMGDQDVKLKMAALDAGIVSQNISVFCAGTDLKTRPRAGFDIAKVKEVLKLSESQHPMLNHPVGYAKN